MTHDGRAILVPNNLTTTGLGIAGAEVITVDRPSEEEYSPSVAGVLQAKVHELICRVEAVLMFMTVNPTNASRDNCAALTETPGVTMRRLRMPLVLVVLVAAWTAVFRVLVGNPAMSGLRAPDGMPNSETLNAAADAAREAFYFEFFLASLPRVIPLYVVGLALIVVAVLLVRRALARRSTRHSRGELAS